MQLEATLLFLDSEGREIKAGVHTEDISPDGAYLLTNVDPGLGEQIQLHLNVTRLEKKKGQTQVLVLFGRVARLDNLPKGIYGLGIDFETHLSDQILKAEFTKDH